MNIRVKTVLDSILERFKTPETLPQAIAHVTFPRPDLPSCKWSLLNRIVMFCSGTGDARGMKQWNKVKRYVRAGSKAIYILAPIIKTVEKKSDAGEKELVLLGGFTPIPVFKVEDTDGEPLEYQQYTLPELPLLERAREWGVSVKTIPENGRYLGCYSPTREEIVLATPDEHVFFHELAHAAHKRVLKALKPSQDWKQEIVAELSAQALCYLVGRQPERTLGNSYNYIEDYAKKGKLSPIMACIKVLSDVEKVLNCLKNDFSKPL